MTERHAEPGADVGSFLPRPGEPAAAYAERLRALHRDLTLVLEAVERGMATSRGPAAAEDPRPARIPPPVPPTRPRRFSRPGGEEARFPEPLVSEGPIDVRPVLDEPAAETQAAAPGPGTWPRPRSGARVVVVPSEPEQGGRVFHRRGEPAPVAVDEATPAVPAEEPPTWPPPAPQRSRVSPLLVVLTVVGWLAAAALALAFALGL